MMAIVPNNYESLILEGTNRPLMIGCSGGAGHNSAIKGIVNFLQDTLGANVEFNTHRPVLLGEKAPNRNRAEIQRGVDMMYIPFVGPVVRETVKLSSFPLLPNTTVLTQEMRSLSANEEKLNGRRQHLDMLLDVYPAGYESAAIWNVLQRNDEVGTLKKLIALQHRSDDSNYQKVYNYYLEALRTAFDAGSPYTEIISTQAMALPALCDAVQQYNLEKNPNPPVIVHQYMTDLPTPGAVHFFNVLSTLTPVQQEQMKLYGVGMEDGIMQHFFPKGFHFHGVYNIPADDNPMVRSGFKDNNLDNSNKFHQDFTLDLGSAGSYIIPESERVASIMLGSQASHDTVEYIESLLKTGVQKVFVFGGTSPHILEKINVIIAAHPEYAAKIIPLGPMDDKQIAPLFTRSNIIITRSGGLSVMEQMATSHSPEQTVLIHHANSLAQVLTSGISWEDDNGTALLNDLMQRNVYAEKTCPNRAVRHLEQAEIIAAIKRKELGIDMEVFIPYLRGLSSTTINQYRKWLEQDQARSLVKHFNKMQKDTFNAGICEQLNTLCEAYLAHVKSKILADINRYEISQAMRYDENHALVPGEYDLDRFLDNRDEYLNGNNNVPHTLQQYLMNYNAITVLKNTINPEGIGSPRRKLRHFERAYRHAETRNGLLTHQDSFLQKIIDEILYQLGRLTRNQNLFNNEQRIRRRVALFSPVDSSSTEDDESTMDEEDTTPASPTISMDEEDIIPTSSIIP